MSSDDRRSGTGKDPGEAFVSRWSRRKTEASAPAPDVPAPPAGVPAENPASGDKGEEGAASLADADMPPLESLGEDSDYSGFLSPGVSEELRSLALRKLFHLPQFNVTDGLNDYDEDYTQFDTLGTVLTHDMRRLRDIGETPGAKRSEDAGEMEHLISRLPASTPDGAARLAALKTMAGLERQAAAVVEFRSQGQVLLIGRPERTTAALKHLGDAMDCTLLEPSASEAPVRFTSREGTPCLSGQLLALEGHLGNFRPRFDGPDGDVDAATASGGWRDHFDLVLDLGDEPVNRSAVHPLGYFAPENVDAVADHVFEAVRGLVGEFEKPKFFTLDPSICAHGRSGVTACTRCIDVCPTDAITPSAEHVEVDSNLCQGAGSCATACPTGAIQYNYPSLQDTLHALREGLRAYRAAGGASPAVLFYGSERERTVVERLAAQFPEHLIPFEVEETASVGLDTWLAALAWGAARIYLVMSPETSPGQVREVKSQLGFADSILEGMGYPPGIVTLVYETEEAIPARIGQQDTGLLNEFAGFGPLDEKRRVIRFAVDHLHDHAPAPRPQVTLPAGAPFGEIRIDAERCTLCMACVSQCPARALEAGGEAPQLKFIEDNCVQCGLCRNTCPEDAITLSPRYLFDRETRARRRIVNEDQPFACIRCGKVFGSQRVIEAMSRKLAAHPMFQGVAGERLHMCEDCRVKDMFEDQVAEDHDG